MTCSALTPESLAILAAVAAGPDAGADAPPFQGPAHALRWYVETQTRRGTAVSSLGRQIETVAGLGVNVQQSGGQSSRQHADLHLLGRVAACFPVPVGVEPPPGAGRGEAKDWQAWVAFKAAAAGCDVARVAREVSRWLGEGSAVEYRQARGLLVVAMAAFRDRLLDARLIPGVHGSGSQSRQGRR